MNASDIIKAKQCATLYKAYYQPTVFYTSSNTLVVSTFYTGTIFPSSTVTISTICPLSTVSTPSGFVSSFTPCINTVNLYTCDKPVISYELANSIQCGKYVCGGKTPSVTTWKANPAMGAISTFATSTLTTSSIATSALAPPSINLYAVRPLICPDPVFVQGTNFQSKCDVCNNDGAGINACCHACASSC